MVSFHVIFEESDMVGICPMDGCNKFSDGIEPGTVECELCGIEWQKEELQKSTPEDQGIEVF